MTSEVNSKRKVDISLKKRNKTKNPQKQRLCFFRNEDEELELRPGEEWETSVPIRYAGHFTFRKKRIPHLKTKPWNGYSLGCFPHFIFYDARDAFIGLKLIQVLWPN